MRVSSDPPTRDAVNVGPHPLAVVAHRQAELPRLVADRDDDLSRLRVLERVAQRLARNAIRFVANDWIEIA